MGLEFCSFASSSSGNCYLVRSETTNLLVDTGIAGKKIYAALDEVNTDIEDIAGILITHEHIDHVKSVRMINKSAKNAKVYATQGTYHAICDKVPATDFVQVIRGQEFMVGDILIRPFALSHDAAEPVSYSFVNNGRQLTIVTDTGYITDEIAEHVKQADHLVLEANHEVNILQMSSYPYSLKRRILGDEGHLSNESAGKMLCDAIKARCELCEEGKDDPLCVVLAHLSKENNTPGQAYLTIRNMLFEEDLFIDKDLILDIAKREESSEMKQV